MGKKIITENLPFGCQFYRYVWCQKGQRNTQRTEKEITTLPFFPLCFPLYFPRSNIAQNHSSLLIG